MPTLPHLPTAVAAGLAGLLCGLVATGLVWGGERSCDAVRGRPSCGGYGLLMLGGIIVICFALGIFVLKAFEVDDPGVTTFFGITLPLLAVLGLLLDYVFDTWMAFGLPVLVAGCFVASAYLARALEAANPSTYTDDEAAAEDDVAPAETGETTSTDDSAAPDDETARLPRYAPEDS